MIVKELNGADQAWRDYIAGSPGASTCHILEWRDVINASFGHLAHYLCAFEDGDNGRIRGVLPLIEMKSVLFGHFLVSLPFLNYGGIVADDGAAESSLAAAAADLAARCGARHIELRQSAPALTGLPGWTLRQHKAALVVDLTPGSKAIWDGIASRLRGKVRKAEKSGAAFSVCGEEALEEFYFLYALNMRDLGTPVYSRSFFNNVMRTFRHKAKILLVKVGGKPAAALIALRDGNHIETPWICQDYGQSIFNVNEFLYWKTIEWGCSEGAEELDLGRSSVDAGTYRFKLQWNPAVRWLNWYIWTPPGVPAPELNPKNPKYARAVEIWKKLPLMAANFFGPSIVRNIP